jgi:hypothetical protein
VIIGRGQRRDRPLLGLAVDEVLRVVSLSGETVASGEFGIIADATIEKDDVKILNTRRLLDRGADDTGAIHG